MKTANLVGLGALALAAYLLYKGTMDKKAKEAKPEADKSPEANMAGYEYAGGYGYASGAPVKPGKRVTVEDLSVKPGLDSRWSLRVRYPRRRPETKQPIYINPLNAIPNVYNRGVGKQVVGMDRLASDGYMNADGTQMYSTFGGSCSADLQTACRCISGKTENFKLDIPQLP